MDTRLKAKTGSATLDKDLNFLFKIVSSSKLKSIILAIKNRSLTVDKFRETVPLQLIRLTVILTNPILFEALKKDVPERSQNILLKAKEVAEKHFREISLHPAASEILRELKEPVIEKPHLKLNTISKTSWLFEWIGKPPKLLPSIRIGFRDKQGDLLLDTSLDWDDLLYVIGTLTEILAEQIEAGIPLAKEKLLDLPDIKKLRDRIHNLQRKVSHIIEIAPGVGIEVESKSSK